MPSKKSINNFWIPKLVKLHYKENGGKNYPLFGTTALFGLGEFKIPTNISYNEMLDCYNALLINELKSILFCYGCGINSQTQRCHIKPHVDGGDETVENLHLLCPNCHIQSEILYGLKYWRWFYNKNTELAYNLMNDERKPIFDKILSYLEEHYPDAKTYNKSKINEVVHEAIYKLNI